MTHASPASPCADCPKSERCFGGMLHQAVIEAGGTPPQITRTVHAQRQYIHRQGDRCDALYLIRGGATKTFVTSTEGEEEISGFQLASDVAGLEAIGAERYRSNLRAITRTWSCRLPLGDVRQALSLSEPFRDELLHRMSDEVSRLHGMLHRERCNAEQRVAAFLMAQLNREIPPAQRAERESLEISLPMSRVDLARYLSLATETVSRVFTRLQGKDLLRSEGSRCVITNAAELARLAAA